MTQDDYDSEVVACLCEHVGEVVHNRYSSTVGMSSCQYLPECIKSLL